MSQVRPGVLVAVIIFAVFTAYAYLAPASYRTSGLFIVSPAVAGSAVSMPEPLEAARRLSEAVLDRKTLAALSSERAGSSDPEAQAQASSAVRRGLEIETSDGRSFVLSYRDSQAERAQRTCNRLAKHAVELAPLVLVDHSAERARELKRQEQTQELAAFLALHPQVAAEAPSPGLTSPDKDPAISAFHAEKANLEHHILQIESGTISDNPYVDPRDSDVKLLHRRLAEIDSALNARRAALDTKPTGANLSPDLRAEWKRLLDAVSQSSATADAPAAAPTLVAKLATSAPLPSAPIEPNRRLFLFFGAVFGVGFGAAFTLVARSAQQRRTTRSHRPPAEAPPGPPAPAAAPVGRGHTVVLPSAPGLPTGLGPSVPVTQPHSNRAPPIIPIPQRQISSAPPDRPALPETGTPASKSSVPPPRVDRDPDDAKRGTSSRPPARRFASTLVLPPAENPALEAAEVTQTPEPALALAEQAWEQQIRAHEVPGFAVVKAGSEPPRFGPMGEPAPIIPPLSSAEVVPAAVQHHPPSRAPNPMKVTQPLGSFLSDLEWANPARARGSEDAPPAPGSLIPPRSPIPPPRSPSPAPPPSQYSYVSTSPPAGQGSVIRVEEVARGWQPDRSLTPLAQRPLCEQLYPYAVEKCFVLAVIGVPEVVSHKSRVAAELALALAESLHPRILLLEGDLHRPRVQRMLGLNMLISNGFSQQMNARSQAAGASPWTVIGCTKSLHVLAEGMMRSPGLLLSKQFADCVKELRSYYDFIVIDGPTMSLDLDSGALDAVTDGLVTVCPVNGSPALAHVQAQFGSKRFSAFAPAP